MNKFILREITSNISSELKQIGFDSAYLNTACDKYRYKNIKIFNLTSAQANILKQTALIFGADCGVNRNVITGNIEKSDAILCGSYSQLKKISKKLSTQPFDLKSLGIEISNFLEKVNRKTRLAGVLNITPDSFSDGGLYFSPKDAENHLISLMDDGADIIDIGAESTKPYSEAIESKEQIKRLTPILKFIQKENIKIPISIDTRSSEVADFALNNGASIINDVSGSEYDKKILSVIQKYNAQIILQHSIAPPATMQESPIYENIMEEIYKFLNNKISIAQEAGISNIIIDPGIGFGKTAHDNFVILDRINELFSLNYPIMIGVSRKSFLGVESNDNNLKDTLSLAVSYPLIKLGVDYLRVHNVKLHKQILNLI